MPSSQSATPTAYPSTSIKPQDQEGSKGLDANLQPNANWGQLEFWSDDPKGDPQPYLQEYVGRDLLRDKGALITGGDSGIGRAVAVLFAREGANISIVYLPEEEPDAQTTKRLVEREGRKCNLMQLDITSRENCQQAVDRHIATLGTNKLNVLVNNAAMQEICQDFRSIDLDSVERTYRTNNLAVFALTKHALAHMKRGDCIVNSSSVAAYMSNPMLVDYASTKAGLVSFTRGLAQQLAPQGIRVNAVAPGIIWTPLQPATKGNPPENMEALGVQEAPLGRPGMPVEVATAYVFLASPLGSYTTGECIHVTGGLEMQG